jgi:hypothetical protein
VRGVDILIGYIGGAVNHFKHHLRALKKDVHWLAV